MAKVSEICDYLFSLAPESLKMDFDNVGMLVGSGDAKVTRALLSLDITSEVINEAVDQGAQLIISHHPVIWDAMKIVNDSTIQSRKVMALVQNGISAICMHTNLDIAGGGVNDVLMELLGGHVTGILEPVDDDHGCGRVGKLKEAMNLNDFLLLCKSRLKSNGLRYYDAGLPVKNIAVMGGSGGGCVELAMEKGCDTYITADIKYDQFLTARGIGINLIDADHFCTENPVIAVLEARINSRFPELQTSISTQHSQTAQFF